MDRVCSRIHIRWHMLLKGFLFIQNIGHYLLSVNYVPSVQLLQLISQCFFTRLPLSQNSDVILFWHFSGHLKVLLGIRHEFLLTIFSREQKHSSSVRTSELTFANDQSLFLQFDNVYLLETRPFSRHVIVLQSLGQ